MGLCLETIGALPALSDGVESRQGKDIVTQKRRLSTSSFSSSWVSTLSETPKFYDNTIQLLTILNAPLSFKGFFLSF